MESFYLTSKLNFKIGSKHYGENSVSDWISDKYDGIKFFEVKKIYSSDEKLN